MHYRKIVVNGKEWQYAVGKQNVRFVAPDGSAFHAGFDAITGERWDDIERAISKGYFRITPSDIAQFIEVR